MPARVWGIPTTAMWVHRLGPEKAKRMMFTGDKISGREAAEMGLVLKSVPDDRLDVEALATRMASVPINQLAMQKMKWLPKRLASRGQETKNDPAYQRLAYDRGFYRVFRDNHRSEYYDGDARNAKLRRYCGRQ